MPGPVVSDPGWATHLGPAPQQVEGAPHGRQPGLVVRAWAGPGRCPQRGPVWGGEAAAVGGCSSPGNVTREVSTVRAEPSFSESEKEVRIMDRRKQEEPCDVGLSTEEQADRYVCLKIKTFRSPKSHKCKGINACCLSSSLWQVLWRPEPTHTPKTKKKMVNSLTDRTMQI